MMRKTSHAAGHRNGRLRRATASLEAVIATGLTFPFAVFLFVLGMSACRKLWHVLASLVGWPYL